jgi:hypothetical protein
MKSKHEQEYIHIKKETLETFFWITIIALFYLTLGMTIYTIGKDNGFKQGFDKGNSLAWQTAINDLRNISCGTDIKIWNNKMNDSYTFQKKCEDYFNFGINPNPSWFFSTNHSGFIYTKENSK